MLPKNMKKTSFKLHSIESLIEELSDEELAACSGGGVEGEVLTSQALLSLNPTLTRDVNIHAGSDQVDGLLT